MNDKPKRVYKSHTFKSSLVWTGGRTWDFEGDETPMYKGAPPKQFRGESGKLTPEDLMLASINTCMLSTITSALRKYEFEFVKFESMIEGVITHTEDRGYMFTEFTYYPKITVKSDEERELVLKLLKTSHNDCWMSQSLIADVTIEPEIIVEE